MNSSYGGIVIMDGLVGYYMKQKHYWLVVSAKPLYPD